MRFEIVGEIARVETIAAGRGIRDLAKLQRRHGKGRWLKKKGIVTARLGNGRMYLVEVHWYEAHGIGKRNLRIKRFLA